MLVSNKSSLPSDGPFRLFPIWVKESLSLKAIDVIYKVHNWVENECIPAEPIMKAQLEKDTWNTPPLMRDLRARAKKEGLFNLFLPSHFKESPGLTNLEYAYCAELLGRNYWAAQTLNCHAPDTGNIELMAKYCNDAQKKKWLDPVLAGDFLSAYSMTEPGRASSDPRTLACRIHREGNEYVINGRKLFGNAIYNPDIRVIILMGLFDPYNPDPWKRHSMLFVPTSSPGLTMKRNLTIMGYAHPPEGHGEFVYDNVRVPCENLILGEGRAFEIAQGRLGPGRIHHCMRIVGQCERAYELALIRCIDERKKPRGKLIGQFDSNIERLAAMRLEVDSMRLLVFNAAHTMDVLGNKAGKYAIAQCKIQVPIAAARVIDECMQLYGGQGLTQHTPLPEMWTYARYVRVADGSDAAHRHQVGREELKSAGAILAKHEAYKNRARDLARLYFDDENHQSEDAWEYVSKI
jgi:alkylation response protein AidB-like acyl-CoA dehydrogenase